MTRIRTPALNQNPFPIKFTFWLWLYQLFTDIRDMLLTFTGSTHVWVVVATRWIHASMNHSAVPSYSSINVTELQRKSMWVKRKWKWHIRSRTGFTFSLLPVCVVTIWQRQTGSNIITATQSVKPWHVLLCREQNPSTVECIHMMYAIPLQSF